MKSGDPAHDQACGAAINPPERKETFMNKNTSRRAQLDWIIRLNFQHEKRLRKIAATLPAHLQQRFLNDHGVEVNDVPAA